MLLYEWERKTALLARGVSRVSQKKPETAGKKGSGKAPPPGDPQGITVSSSVMAYALRMSVRTLNHHALNDGCPRISPGKFDVAQVVQWYTGFLRASIKREHRVDTLEEVERRHAAAKAQLSELEVGKQLGLTMLREEHRRLVSEMVSTAKAQLFALPSKLAPALAHADEVRIEQELRREIRDAMDSLARRGDPDAPLKRKAKGKATKHQAKDEE